MVSIWLAYHFGGARASVICLIVGVVIIVVAHFFFSGERKPLEPVAPLQRQEANPTLTANPKMEQHLHMHMPQLTPPPLAPAKPVPPHEPVLRPNLQFRRIYTSRIWVGHEISGHNVDVFLVEIGNELGSQVGRADDVRAHVTYKKKDETLQIICPAQWRDCYKAVYIGVGESASVVLAVNKGIWFSREYDGIVLQPCSEIELRIVDKGGDLLLGPIVFDCAFGNYSTASCQRRQAAC